MNRTVHQCHKTGCDSEAQWSVQLGFWSDGNGLFRHHFTCESTINVCGKHQKEAMEFILSPVNRGRIAFHMMQNNLPPPDFTSAEITFSRIDHDQIDADIASDQATAEMQEQLRAH